MAEAEGWGNSGFFDFDHPEQAILVDLDEEAEFLTGLNIEAPEGGRNQQADLAGFGEAGIGHAQREEPGAVLAEAELLGDAALKGVAVAAQAEEIVQKFPGREGLSAGGDVLFSGALGHPDRDSGEDEESQTKEGGTKRKTGTTAAGHIKGVLGGTGEERRIL